jgi:ADP-ribosylglycohydrolase
MHPNTSLKDQAAGAVMATLFGDALALGRHWYDDLEELRRNYGEWITGYTNPMPGHYHEELKAGQPSRSGVITTMLLRSMVENEGYKKEDFCRRLDEDLFPLLDAV